jgi:asparaginyl-tRNA synthetase
MESLSSTVSANAAAPATGAATAVAEQTPLLEPTAPIDRTLATLRKPLPIERRIRIHNAVVQRIRAFLHEEGYEEVPVPELTAATGSCEVVDSMFSLDYFGWLAFPRQTGQLYLEEVVAGGMTHVYCEGESLRREWKVDARHLTEFKLIETEQCDMTLAELCDFQERLLKDVAARLHPDLIGWQNAARIDRMVRAEHPRLTYREALAALSGHGFTLRFGDDLDREAEAALVRHCGDLPVQVTHYPESIKFFNMKIDRRDPAVVECVDYILPCAGETFGGSVRECDYEILRRRLYDGTMYQHLMTRAQEFARQRCGALPAHEQAAACEELTRRSRGAIEQAFDNYLGLFKERLVQRAGFGLGIARLLQYLMGIDSIKEVVAFPMDRTCFGGLGQTVKVE